MKRPITVEGFTYPTITEAWLAESPPSVSRLLVGDRLHKGWSPERALRTPVYSRQQLELPLWK